MRIISAVGLQVAVGGQGALTVCAPHRPTLLAEEAAVVTGVVEAREVVTRRQALLAAEALHTLDPALSRLFKMAYKAEPVRSL